MAELGSIYDESPSAGERGRDLRVSVRYPAWALGDAEGAWIDVPDQVTVDGESVPRTASPHDRPGQVLLRLPESFPEGGFLRLRGQGERPPGGAAGDLFLEINFDREAARPAGGASPQALMLPSTAALIALAVLGAAAYLLLVR